MNGGALGETQRTIERVARESDGRLVAYLSANTHDVAAAGDALSEALLKALRAGPGDGLPQNPEALVPAWARSCRRSDLACACASATHPRRARGTGPACAHAVLRIPTHSTTGTGSRLHPAVRTGYEAVVASFNRRGGASFGRSFSARSHRPISTRSSHPVRTFRARAHWTNRVAGSRTLL